MANYVNDEWVPRKKNVTSTANLCAKSLVTFAGAVPANAANSVLGVVEQDTKSGEVATVKVPPSVVEVIATGTVTAGAYVEVLTASIYGNIDGTSTAITAAGVQDQADGYSIGKAYTGGSANDTVLIALLETQAANACV